MKLTIDTNKTTLEEIKILELAIKTTKETLIHNETRYLDNPNFPINSKRGKINIIKEIIIDLTKEGYKEIEIKEIIKIAKTEGLNDNDVSEVIEKLKRSGDIYQPKPDHIEKL